MMACIRNLDKDISQRILKKSRPFAMTFGQDKRKNNKNINLSIRFDFRGASKELKLPSRSILENIDMIII